MKRTPINPWTWSLKYGYNQGEVIEGSTRQLICSGQTAVNAEGKPKHLDDMHGQITLAFNNLEAVLNAANMGIEDITRLNIFTTDVDSAMAQLNVLEPKLGSSGVLPPMSLLGVTRLAIPGLMIEIEATANQ